MSRVPVIGLSCYVEDVDRAPWSAQRSAVLDYRYVASLQDAGAVVVILPPRDDADDALAASVLQRLDGLVLAGGVDVEASRYGADPHPGSQDPRPDRDAWELALLRAAYARDLPVLGICRGMQVMAVEAGAVLEQHIPDRVGTEVHSVAPGVMADHPVVPVPGTRVAAILGTDPVDVPTYHHQAVDPGSLAATGFVPSAWHADGTLEAMEDPRRGFRVAVQWHPESGSDPRLFVALLRAAEHRAAPGR